MSAKHVVITGANRGIGLALARQFHERGDEVTAVCRQPSPELERLGVAIIDGIDVTDTDARNLLAERLENETIDMLVNNAGILEGDDFDSFAEDSILRQVEVNAVAPLALTRALRSQLKQGSKVIMITSRMGSMADNGSGGQYGYRMSKAALNAAGVSLANDFKDAGIAVAMLHPGYVQTDMVGNRGDISATEAAIRLVQRMDEVELSNTGSFRHSNGETLPW
ncbi:SDR family oxidoreductase [Pseudidiomarina sp. 1APR75-15]|uniref:SDR family oxidoreductase n=1 Tax=Pseudidiomarina terrestris TaxID=2820060 RepID=A0ABT8MG46_9GAMM|nr:SDR family oxidoreductase [Pseudidiomarina sp. 1APR75-15]MDN7128921.1 SDR family oxidoreductase [Pseudidiomarina sp. 1APR75-15]